VIGLALMTVALGLLAVVAGGRGGGARRGVRRTARPAPRGASTAYPGLIQAATCIGSGARPPGPIAAPISSAVQASRSAVATSAGCDQTARWRPLKVSHWPLRSAARSLVTSRVAARAAQPRGENYAASKAAVEALVRGLAAELARHAIRANAIVPGWIRSPLADPLLDADAVREKVLPRVPMRRWGDPADFRSAAVFLASRASAYMTGQALVIDGGYPVF
jgi:NAD(P)-dependent dehydrogenase (short-subunit alcohol dehydrogenase family)